MKSTFVKGHICYDCNGWFALQYCNVGRRKTKSGKMQRVWLCDDCYCEPTPAEIARFKYRSNGHSPLPEPEYVPAALRVVIPTFPISPWHLFLREFRLIQTEMDTLIEKEAERRERLGLKRLSRIQLERLILHRLERKGRYSRL